MDLTGYAARRNEVWPPTRRGATRLSPYIRHGLLPLPAVWAAAAGAPPRDRAKFRDELLWQEYARHLYARVGAATAHPLRFEAPVPAKPWPREPWPQEMACMAATTQELHTDGWLVNQTRMWLASQYAVRAGADWREGAAEMYRHLLDGSPAANRLGWQWAVGTGTGKVYGFSRWQVEKRAPGLCGTCALRRACPVQDWPDAEAGPRVEPPAGLAGGVSDAGPEAPQGPGAPDTVWLTAESLGDTDPALAAHPGLPAVFVLDEPLLARLRLSGKRLVFLAETLAELGVDVHLGDPVEELRGRRLAVTHAPVPGFARRAARLDVVVRHPWPWLRRPGTGSLRSFSAWSRSGR
nr:FAD-binding domain-containing protein [Kineococcus siccus]